MSNPNKADELRAAIAGLESQRSLVGDAVINSAIAALRQQLEALDAPATAAPAEERKNVTILFVDVSGFTALAERLDPEEVRNVINACFDGLVPIVQKYGGTIDKFIGDEIMALFGAPIAHENDPERALRSALEMMDRISRFNQDHGTSLSLHIGANTGPVVTGAIGSRDRKDYSVMGDAVNLAARLEDASPDGEIYVGPNTFRLTAALFDFEPLPSLTLKGKAQPLSVYRLVGLKAKPRSQRGIEGLRSELVGRSRELETIRNVVQALQRGKGGILAVVGEAGVGKSRLVSEGFSTMPNGVCRAEGRALSHTTGMSYWMAGDVLRGLLGITENAPAEKLELSLRQNLKKFSTATFEETYPYLATLLHLPLQQEMEERVKYLSTEALHGRILQAFRQFVSARAKEERLILFWEDLHWCDPSSLRVAEALLPLTNEVPLLLVLAYRPEEDTGQALQRQVQAAGADRFHLIKLSPLTREQSGSLVQALLQIENLPPRMRDLLLDRAEGNPFFIEELLRSLLDSGALDIQSGRVVALSEIEQARIPETVEGVLSARMDRLAAADKNALQSAAVIGRMFQHTVLERITAEGAGTRLDHSLSELQRRDFIRPAKQARLADDDYIFKHAITQDVAYHALLKARRKEVHHKVGEAIEALFPSRLTELSPTLAYHFERAEAPAKAFHYLTQAGERAQATFANTEAAAFYRSAIIQGEALLEKKRQPETITTLAHIRESLGDVLRLVGQNEEARANYTGALGLLPNSDRVPRSRLQRKIGAAYTVERRFAAMAEAFDAADKELGQNEVEPAGEWWKEKMQTLLERMHLLYWQGMSDEMRQLADRHRVDVEQKGSPIQRGKFFQMLGLSLLTRDHYVASDEAVRLTELAVSTSSESADLSETSHVRFTAGLTHLWHGDLKEAVDHFRAALALSERIGDLVVQVRCVTYLAVAYRRLADNNNTGAFAERTVTLASQLGMVEYVAMAKANLAWLAWREDRRADAQLLGREALKLWHGMEDPYGFDWLALLPLIAVAVAERRFSDAINCTRELFGENQHPVPAPLTAAAKSAITAAAQNGATAAATELQELVEVSKAIGYL